MDNEEKKKLLAEEEKKLETLDKSEEEQKEETPKADESEKDSAEKEESAKEPKDSPEADPEPEPKSESESDTSENDKLKAENLRLKTELEALKIGFSSDNLEDAMILAENIVKRDGTDITSALQTVAKKYPDWKSDSKESKSKGGFKVGADSSNGKSADSEKLNKAFGIKKKK